MKVYLFPAWDWWNYALRGHLLIGINKTGFQQYVSGVYFWTWHLLERGKVENVLLKTVHRTTRTPQPCKINISDPLQNLVFVLEGKPFIPSFVSYIIFTQKLFP